MLQQRTQWKCTHNKIVIMIMFALKELNYIYYDYIIIALKYMCED